MDCLKNISTTDVVQAIHGAYKRVVFLAPGIDEATAEALQTAWQRLGPEAVTVVLDIDAEIVRLGYGTEEGLEQIQKTAAACNQAIGHQPGVRICVVIADDTTLIFTPTPLLIEGGSKEPDRPNGITLHATPKALGDELGIGEEGHAKREIGMEPVKAERIQAVKQDLHDNPPLKFDISRKERVFNAKLEFVEFEMEGCFLSTHTVPIPPNLLGLAKKDPQTRGRLRSSFSLIEKDDVLDAKKKVSEKLLRDERKRISRLYLRPVKGYGVLIRRANRTAFENEVTKLQELVETFREAVRAKLGSIFAGNAKRLTKLLLPSIAKNFPEEWIGALGPKPTRKEIEEMLHQTLLRSFGEPESLLREMRVTVTFKGVTYGTLVDPEFVKEAGEQFPNLKLHDEYDAARGSAATPPASPKPPAGPRDLFEP